MKKAVLIVLGLVLLLLGLVGASAGVGAYMIFGSKGAYTSKVATGSSDGVALYVSSFHVQQGWLPKGLFDISLSARATNAKTAFVGVAPITNAQTYLAGAPYGAVAELNAGTMTVKPVPGSKSGVPAPEAQTFWIEKGQGDPATIPWQAQEATDVLMFMNADGTPGVAVDIDATLSRDGLPTAMIVAVVVGAVLVVVGIVLIWAGVRSGRKRRTEAA